jgi:hypothetical protein
MAKLPEGMIEKIPRTLAHLQPGERAAFPLYGFILDADHNLVARLGVELDQRDPKLEYGEIWRDQKGAFHADLKGTRRRWKPEDLHLYEMSKNPQIVHITSIVGTESDG